VTDSSNKYQRVDGSWDFFGVRPHDATAGAANDARAEAEAELREALRERDQAVRRAAAPVVDTWRAAQAQAIEDARGAVQAAMQALDGVSKSRRSR
jgi:hypothetical protein